MDDVTSICLQSIAWGRCVIKDMLEDVLLMSQKFCKPGRIIEPEHWDRIKSMAIES